MELVEEQATTSEKAQLTRGKKILFTLISILFIFIVMGCVGEIVLRILPLGRYRSAPFRQYDPEIGLALVPSRHVVHSRGCFQGEVSTNSWGMRDRERTLEKPAGEFRIAMIGDSAVEAVQVKPQEVINVRMENLLHEQGYKNIEVMDFAVEGIGTTQELLLYQKKVRQFHPDLVLLMFSTNDIFNNSSTLQPKAYGIHDWYAPYYDLAPDGSLEFKPVETRHFEKLRTFLELHSVLFYYLERMWLQFDIPLHKWQGMPVFYGTYAEDPLDPEWQQAWQITEKVLVRMRDTVNADGAKFVVMPWPDSTDIDPNWRQRMNAQFGKLPAAFGPTKPEDRLRELTTRAQVPLIFFTPEMQRYRDQHHLQWPYFSLTCDPHFSALGHQVSAQSVLKELQDHNLLPAPAAQP